MRMIGASQLDFGPCLGPVQDYDMRENRIPGAACILPSLYKDPLSRREVRVSLHPVLMGKIRKDKLLEWLELREMPRL